MGLWNIYHPEIPEFLQAAAQTPAMQRLRDVGMNCGCEYTDFPVFAGIRPYSRFDHSVGVGLIVWHFTGSRQQAMAGLLHDIATPVFAHVIDFLHGDHMTQESTEADTAARIRRSGQLRQVLERYGLDTEAVEDYHRYPIADNDSPRLCADRLEYTLGNAVNYGILSAAQARACYEDLTVDTNEFEEPELVFRSAAWGEIFASAALECSKIYVSDPDRYAMEALAALLKQAIARGVLTEADLYSREQTVIARLEQSEFREEWQRFRNFHKILRRDTPGPEEGWKRIFAKKRCIDPYILQTGRVSALSPAFAKELQSFRAESQDYWLKAR